MESLERIDVIWTMEETVNYLENIFFGSVMLFSLSVNTVPDIPFIQLCYIKCSYLISSNQIFYALKALQTYEATFDFEIYFDTYAIKVYNLGSQILKKIIGRLQDFIIN